jgi:hypothetical protein
MDGDGRDISGNGLDAQELNIEWVPGVSGLAAFSNGDVVALNALYVPDSDILDIDNPFMVAWIMRTSNDVSSILRRLGPYGMVMNKEASYQFAVVDGSGYLQGAFIPGCYRWGFGNSVVPLNEWTHVGVGVDGNHEMHYVNGEFTERDSCPGSCVTNGNKFRIGSRTWGPGMGQFLGSIDEAMLFSGMLEPAQIIDVYDGASQEGECTINVLLLRTCLQSCLPAYIHFWCEI